MLSRARCIDPFPCRQLRSFWAFLPFSGKIPFSFVHLSFFQDCLSTHWLQRCMRWKNLSAVLNCYCLMGTMKTCWLQDPHRLFHTSFFSSFPSFRHSFPHLDLPKDCFFGRFFLESLAQGSSKLFWSNCIYADRQVTRLCRECLQTHKVYHCSKSWCGRFWLQVHLQQRAVFHTVKSWDQTSTDHWPSYLHFSHQTSKYYAHQLSKPTHLKDAWCLNLVIKLLSEVLELCSKTTVTLFLAATNSYIALVI